MHIEECLMCSENTFQHQLLFVLCLLDLARRPKDWLSVRCGDMFGHRPFGVARRTCLFDLLVSAFGA